MILRAQYDSVTKEVKVFDERGTTKYIPKPILTFMDTGNNFTLVMGEPIRFDKNDWPDLGVLRRLLDKLNLECVEIRLKEKDTLFRIDLFADSCRKTLL